MLDFKRRVLDALARLEQAQADQGRLLARILREDTTIMLDTTALVAKVSALESVQQGAITLLQALSAAVKAIPTDDPATQAAIDQITSRLDSDQQALAAAVVANTPTAPTAGTPPSGGSTPPTTTNAG